MRKFYLFAGLLLALSFFGCEGGSTAARTPNQLIPQDCYAYGNCVNSFQNGFYRYPNVSPYQVPYGQSPYTNNGFTGCGYNQYPTFYPNYGYVCLNQNAFTTGYNYGTWGYQPTSYEFMSASGYQFPNYYNYNFNFALQGCILGGATTSCGCQQLYGVPSYFGVCAAGTYY